MRASEFDLKHWLHGPLGKRLVVLGVCSLLLGAVEILRLNDLALMVGKLSENAGNGPSTWDVVRLIALFCLVQPLLYLAVINLRMVSIETLSYNDIAQGFFKTLMAMPFHVLHQRTTGETLDHARAFPGSITALGAVLISDAGYFIAFVVMLAFVLFNTSSLLILPVIFWIVALIVVGFLSYRRLEALSGEARDASGALTSTQADLLDNLILVKTNARDTFPITSVGEKFSDIRDKSQAIASRSSFLAAAVNLVNGVTIAFGVCILLYLYHQGTAELAMFVLFVPVMLQLSAISQIAMMSINEGLIAIGQIKYVRDTYDIAQAAKPATPSPDSAVRATGLTLSHPQSSEAALDGTSFVFHKAERIGIAAPSGSGKSTLLLAVAGLLPPRTGTLATATLDDRIAICSQEPQIIHATVEQNLLFGAADATTPEQITEVLRLVELDQLAPPDALKELISPRGIGLSGGQKQRLSLARAILARPDILLLDEALSGLDEGQEQRILAALDIALPDTTILIASHRPGSLSKCDRIFTIKDRKVVEVTRGGTTT